MLMGISCADTGDCTAVGAIGSGLTGHFADPNVEPIYKVETAGRWGALHVLHDPANSGVFTSVSCVDPEDCTAVGYDYAGGFTSDGSPVYGYPIRAEELAGQWSAVTQVKDAEGETFTSVSCTSPTDCTAVGSGPSAATETNGTWGRTSDFAGPTLIGGFNGVSCVSAGNCTAVGGDEGIGDGGNIPPFLVPGQPIGARQVNGIWGPVAEISAPMGSAFNAISCVATDCVAVGNAATGDSDFSAVESDGVWEPVATIALPGLGDLAALSCWAATDCAAVGTVVRPRVNLAQMVHVVMHDGAWGSPTTVGGGSLGSVSCRSATTCGAVGNYTACVANAECRTFNYAVATREVNGAWTDVPGPPTLRTVTALDARLVITWTAPSRDRPEVTGYDAVATDVVDAARYGVVCSTTRATSCTIRGLTNGTTYTIAVFARSRAGSSALSAVQMATPTPHS